MPANDKPARPELQHALAAIQDARNAARKTGERHRFRAPLVDVSMRTPDGASATGDGSYTITGHAAVTGQETVLFDMGWLRVRERIAPSAFDRVLADRPDVHLNINHDMKYAMARTGVAGVGSLELSMDARGLRTFATVSSDLSFVRDLAVQMKTGLIDQMSFAFDIADETRSEVDDGETVDVLYEINEVGNLYDVCVCAQGAYPTTDSNLRSLVAALGRGSFNLPGRTEDRDDTDSSGAHDDRRTSIDLVGGDSKRAVELATLRAQARVASLTYLETP